MAEAMGAAGVAKSHLAWQNTSMTGHSYSWFANREYDYESANTFPWPAVAGYDDIHRWMDQGQAVHAAWQVRDVWEGLIKFLGVLAVADRLSHPENGQEVGGLLSLLLKPQGLALGDWTRLMELAQKSRDHKSRLPALRELLFPARRPKLFKLLVGGDARQSFVCWRNRRFGHGAFGKDLALFAEEARHWLDRLHEAYDLCRDFFGTVVLDSVQPDGAALAWTSQPPLPFYHQHCPPADGTLVGVSLRTKTGGDALSLTPLLSIQTCRICGQWAAFYLDRYEPGRKRAWFLDFVEGHSHDVRGIETLERWSSVTAPAPAAADRHAESDVPEAREPDPARFRDFVGEFVPPLHLAGPIADFLQAGKRGIILLTGPGGGGKSWFCRGLEHSSLLPALLGRIVPVLYASLDLRPDAQGRVSKRDVLERLGQWASKEKKWDVPSPEATTDLVVWLTAVMRANALGELVVVLDGWDELPDGGDVPSLVPEAHQLPPGCFLLLAGRPELRPAAAAAWTKVRLAATAEPRLVAELSIGADNTAHREVLKSYAAARLKQKLPDGQPLPEEWAGPLVDLAQGSFLHTFHYCRALRFGIFESLDQLPAPADYYPAFFANLASRVGPALFERHYARALLLIAEFHNSGANIGDLDQSGLSAAELAALGLERMRLVVILDDLADLLQTTRPPDSGETLFRLGHESIREFLASDPAWCERAKTVRRMLIEHTLRRFGNDWSALDLHSRLERGLVHRIPLWLEDCPEYFDRLRLDPRLIHLLVQAGDELSAAVDSRLQRSLREVWHSLSAGLLLTSFRVDLLAALADFEDPRLRAFAKDNWNSDDYAEAGGRWSKKRARSKCDDARQDLSCSGREGWG